MPMTSPTIEDGVATSPRLYSSAFRSNQGRFAKLLDKESTNLQYNVKQFDTAVGVERSPRKLAAVFAAPREARSADDNEPNVPYNLDSFYMNKTSILHGQDNIARNYGFNHTSDRFRPNKTSTDNAQDFYDTYTLHKMGIQERVVRSPRLYSNMKTSTQRAEFVPTINADYFPNNHAVEYNVPRSPQRYSIMSSPVGRPDPTSVIKMHDGQYNTDALNKASVAHVAQDRQNSRAFKAPPRLPMANLTSAPDKVYDPDTANKTSLWTGITKSGNPYQGMIHSARDSDFKVPAGTQLDYTGGIEANPIKPSLAYSVAFSPRLLHNVRTKTPRFTVAKPQPQTQAIYDANNCPKGTGSIQKRILESPRKYFGGQSMTQRSMATTDNPSLHLQYDANYGKTKSLAAEVAASPALYSNMRSVIPRFKELKKTATMDEYEQLLRNPDTIDLKFQIRGNVVVKKTTDRALLVVGRQAPPGTS